MQNDSEIQGDGPAAFGNSHKNNYILTAFFR